MNQIETKISDLVRLQFPQFYRSEGPVFIAFVQAYYEWLESEDNVLYRGRRFFDYTDIDATLEDFLVYYQKKYLYGIPFDVIINKRYLLKHVLDVYRTKGSIQCYRLLFKLIYDEEIDVYLPGTDVLRVSDGTWKEPKYLEVSKVDNLQDFVGKTIIGLGSKTKAVVESYVTEAINGNIVATLYISNILPKGAEFDLGEKIIDVNDLESDDLANIVAAAPTIRGSLDYVEIVNGGRDFAAGDILKIVRNDITTNEVIANGVEGMVRVVDTVRGRGSLEFNIERAGSGILDHGVEIYLYNKETDTTGMGANFDVLNLSGVENHTYNTDILADYADMTLDSVAYNMPFNPSANASTPLEDMLTFKANNFGSLLSLTNINTGNSYTASPYIFVRSTQLSGPMTGTVSYATNSNTVTGTSTEFERFFANGDVIALQANTSLANTIEKVVIKTVNSNTSITLYGPPTRNSTASAVYRVAPSIMSSQFAYYEEEMYEVDSSIPGLNAEVEGTPSVGNNIINTTTAINSGKAYVEGEPVKMYLYGAVASPTILDGGSGYSNGEMLVFAGGNAIKLARGVISTNSIGGITSVSMAYSGSGYTDVPTVTVRTAAGSGAVLQTSLQEFNTVYEVTGKVRKKGIGRQKGYFSTTRGFLNSDKYIQDSYFYQDFSYQIKVAAALSKYRDILYNTFHIAGTELFGQYVLIREESSLHSIEYEQTEATIS